MIAIRTLPMPNHDAPSGAANEVSMFLRARIYSIAAASLVAASTVWIAGATTALAAQTNAPAAAKTAITVQTFARGLENPWGLQFLPDGRLLVTERPGRVRIIGKDGKLSPPVSGVPKVHAQGQGGLLDVRLAPDFANTGTIFLSYAEPRDGGKSGTAVARAKLVLDGTSARIEGLNVIFRQDTAVASNFHFGSRVVPAPDGSLFVTTGDRGSQRNEAQNPGSHIGKVIRIMPDGQPAADNPKLAGWKPEVWSYGHRNIQGAAIDPATGQLWTVEHGARGGDELNSPQKGKNYGWPVITYGRDYSGFKIGEGTARDGMEQPVYYWDPSIATSGLAFYTGSLFPAWKGNILVGGLSGAQLSRLVVEGGKIVAEEKLLEDRGDRIRDVRVGPDGAIWLVVDDSDGKILRLTPAAK